MLKLDGPGRSARPITEVYRLGAWGTVAIGDSSAITCQRQEFKPVILTLLPLGQVPRPRPPIWRIIKRKFPPSLFSSPKPGPRPNNLLAFKMFVNCMLWNSWWIVHKVSPKWGKNFFSLLVQWLQTNKQRFLEAKQKDLSVMSLMGIPRTGVEGACGRRDQREGRAEISAETTDALPSRPASRDWLL